VIVDLRPESSTYRQWIGTELSAKNRHLLYVPEGFAHGYQSLSEDAELFYQTTAPYCVGAEKGIRWDDPSFKIEWPLAVQAISEKDKNHPLFTHQ
jgi:dTDP-4-dehydrorhamnose 3,5-epimerase